MLLLKEVLYGLPSVSSNHYKDDQKLLNWCPSWSFSTDDIIIDSMVSTTVRGIILLVSWIKEIFSFPICQLVFIIKNYRFFFCYLKKNLSYFGVDQAKRIKNKKNSFAWKRLENQFFSSLWLFQESSVFGNKANVLGIKMMRIHIVNYL